MALNKAINTVTKAVSVRTTIPILKGILLDLKGSTLKMTSSNLDFTIQTSLEVQDPEEGSLVVDARMFSEVVRRLPNAMVSVESDVAGNLRLNCLGSDFSFVCFSAEEYPSLGSIEEIKRTTVRNRDLCDIIKKTSFAASIDEKKGIIIGCLIDFRPDRVEMCALDGFRMSIANFETEDGIEGRVVVQARMLSDIAKLLSESDPEEEVLISIDEKRLQLSCEDTVMTARLLVGDFLEYRNLIPKDHRTRFIISRDELQASLERASLFAREGQNNLIKFTVSEGRLEISSRSEEGQVSEKILCETEGAPLSIGFNSKFILEVLKAVDDEEIMFDLIDSVSSCLIKPVEGDSYLFFILPVRIVSA
jgi:DNA polymerase-3 subunit beta